MYKNVQVKTSSNVSNALNADNVKHDANVKSKRDKNYQKAIKFCAEFVWHVVVCNVSPAGNSIFNRNKKNRHLTTPTTFGVFSFFFFHPSALYFFISHCASRRCEKWDNKAMAFGGGGEHEHHFSFRMWVKLLASSNNGIWVQFGQRLSCEREEERPPLHQKGIADSDTLFCGMTEQLFCFGTNNIDNCRIESLTHFSFQLDRSKHDAKSSHNFMTNI